MHIGISSILVLFNLLCFPRLCILASRVFQFCILYFASVTSPCRHLKYFSSVYFTLLSSPGHIDICSISVLYILLCFTRLCILTSAVFYFCIFDFTFLISAYWYMQFLCPESCVPCLVSEYSHLKYFNSWYFSLLFSFLHIEIWSISVRYIWLYFDHLCILTSVVF